MSAPTPELDKLLASVEPRKVNDTLTSFVDWLERDGIVLARYGASRERTRKCRVCHGRGFNPHNLNARQQQLLAKGMLPDSDRQECPRCFGDGQEVETFVDEESLAPIHESYTMLFARFLDIDMAKVDAERRAILDELRQEAP